MRMDNMASLPPRANGCRGQLFFARLSPRRYLSHRPGTGSESDELRQGQLANLRGNPNSTREIKIRNSIPRNILLYSSFQHDYGDSEDGDLV